LIKSGFSRALPKDLTSEKQPTNVAYGNGITGSMLSPTTPTTNHVDYVHVNPLKHGYVKRVEDWTYSTFHRYVAKGIYPADWCGDINSVVGGDE